MKRDRRLYALWVVLTVALGLASRLPILGLPKPTGDVLYAVMAFWLGGCLRPAWSTSRLTLGALLFCVVIEFAKFIDMPFMVAVRHHPLGHLVFGTGFQASNLLCYGLGAAIGAGLELLARSRAVTTT